jgi:Tropinone reductase 1
MSVNPWQLKGQRALITGGTKGIGSAIVDEVLNLGGRVYLVARSAADVESTCAELRERGFEVYGEALDISKRESRRQLIEKLQNTWGGLELLVNNVGTNIRKAAIDYTAEEYHQIMETNLTATFDLCALAHPLLKHSQPAAVVNVLSVAGLTHLRTGAPYGMSKAALLQMTRNLAVEWAADGIRVNAVAPWYTWTPLAEQVLKDKAFQQEVLDRTPLKRIAKPAEVARAAVFLGMPAASYITGQCLTVDGGFSVNGFG